MRPILLFGILAFLPGCLTSGQSLEVARQWNQAKTEWLAENRAAAGDHAALILPTVLADLGLSRSEVDAMKAAIAEANGIELEEILGPGGIAALALAYSQRRRLQGAGKALIGKTG